MQRTIRPTGGAGTVSIVLRGESLRLMEGTEPVRQACTTAQGKTINGVPVSAAQHCCGRACEHCRIYWRKTDV